MVNVLVFLLSIAITMQQPARFEHGIDLLKKALITLVAAVSILATAVSSVEAEVQTIMAEHTYVVGDNDSKNDARQLCFLQAKRKVLEKAGTFIESSSEAKNFQLTKDQVTSYAAAVLSVETIKEEFGVSNGQTTLSLTVKADVDLADVQKRLAAIVADRSLQDRIAAQQRQIGQLEQQVQQLNQRLNVAPANASGELRKERNIVFGNLQELENKKMAAVRAITEKTEIIRNYLVRNMTRKEVLDILGDARTSTPFGTSLNYGELWICFKNDLLDGVGVNDRCSPNQLR